MITMAFVEQRQVIWPIIAGHERFAPASWYPEGSCAIVDLEYFLGHENTWGLCNVKRDYMRDGMICAPRAIQQVPNHKRLRWLINEQGELL